MILALVGLLVLGQWQDDAPTSGRVRELGGARVRGREGLSYAFFEAFPLSGAGTSGACSTTAPTGAKGEALTFTRASNGTCTKTASGGLATTGIANGDLVVLSSNQPRVMYDANGTLGLLVESARTNYLVRSEALDNAAWTLNGAGGAAAPSRTGDAAVAPDGATTAEEINFVNTAACAPLCVSSLYQSVAGSAAAWTMTAYIKGKTGSGTTYLYATPDGVTYISQACNFVSTSWTRCTLTGTLTAVAWFWQIGTDTRSAGMAAGTAAADAYVWGVQVELGAYATSYIPTVAATTTRVAESAYFAASVSPRSIAATQWVPWANAPSNSRALRVDDTGSDNNRFELFTTSGAKTLASFVAVAASPQTVTTGAGTYPGSMRLAGWRTPSTTQAGIIGGVETTAATALGALPTLNRVYVGVYAGAGLETDGIVSRVCVDPDSARCR